MHKAATRTPAGLTAILVASSIAWTCGGTGASRGAAPRTVIRITGSDTMVNLVQAWAEHYGDVRPAVSLHVAGGGSGVGIAGLIDATVDIAAASRDMKGAERQRLSARHGAEPAQFTVALDAIAVYVHPDNPLASLSIADLAEIYGEQGRIVKWSQLGLHNVACRGDDIIRVGRQNNSGTYTYFRDVVLGRAREYGMGSIDQSGSKDVVALVSRTPCAIGYSGIAFATADVKTLGLSFRRGDQAVIPSAETVSAGAYPMARPLYLYTPPGPTGAVREFIDWVLSAAGQQIVRELGFVPLPNHRL